MLRVLRLGVVAVQKVQRQRVRGAVVVGMGQPRGLEREGTLCNEVKYTCIEKRRHVFFVLWSVYFIERMMTAILFLICWCDTSNNCVQSNTRACMTTARGEKICRKTSTLAQQNGRTSSNKTDMQRQKSTCTQPCWLYFNTAQPLHDVFLSAHTLHPPPNLSITPTAVNHTATHTRH